MCEEPSNEPNRKTFSLHELTLYRKGDNNKQTSKIQCQVVLGAKIKCGIVKCQDEGRVVT